MMNPLTSQCRASPEHVRTPLRNTAQLPAVSAAVLATLIAIALVINFTEGVTLGERGTLFYPLYRTRQTLAVALSMMHLPPLGGYLAYGSIVNLLTTKGFHFSDNSNDPNDALRIAKLFASTAYLNDTLADALQTAIDASLPPDTIKANDLGYADYMRMAFTLFGLKVSSVYDFYFLMLSISIGAYLMQFYRSRTMLYVLTAYLSVHLFVIQYCNVIGLPAGSIANSRTFSCLALLPTIHISALLILGADLSFRTLFTTCMQALLLSFIVLCRFEAAWELGSLGAIATFAALRVTGDPKTGTIGIRARARQLWPALVVLLAFGGLQSRQDLASAPAYRSDSARHVVWHEILLGLLSTDPSLIGKYTDVKQINSYVFDDRVACEAVNHLLRHHTASPYTALYNCDDASNLFNGHAGVYDTLARRVVIQIIIDHPLLAISELKTKFADQIRRFGPNVRSSFQHIGLIVSLIWCAATVLYAACGEPTPSRRDVVNFTGGAAIILACALLSPAIEPSVFAMGTLAAYLLVGLLSASFLVLFALKYLSRYDP